MRLVDDEFFKVRKFGVLVLEAEHSPQLLYGLVECRYALLEVVPVLTAQLIEPLRPFGFK